MNQKPNRQWAKKVWDILNNSFIIKKDEFVVHYVNDPFGILVAIILSQNTSDKNSIKALKMLKEKIGLTPEKIASASISNIEDAIRVAGLYKAKTRAIKNLAKKVLEGLDLYEVLRLPLYEARKILLSLEGIGKKTTDVFLSIHGKRIMGIDVHAMRIALRWGLITKRSYDDAQRAFVSLFDFVDDLDYLHKLLITLGRKYCRAKNPLCEKCPLKNLCPSYKKLR